MQTPPGTTLGVVGGGQLGRMLAEAASPLGVDVVVLDPTPDCPASTPAADHIEGDFDDPAAFAELAARSDALTFEIELADPDLLADVDIPVHPKPATLRTTEDKLAEKEALAEAGVPVPAFRRVDDAADLESAFDDLGEPLMLKARHGGYDGRGNHVTESVADAEEYFDDLEGLVAEELVDFERELSVIGAKGASEDAQFPVVENVHEAEILRETRVPPAADDAVVRAARDVVGDVLDVLEGRGVYGVELFEVSGEVLVNEIAPRPHNSGHYTIEGAVTSQFEQHVRAVLGLPLGDPSLRGPTAMVNVLGDVEETKRADLAGVPGALAVPTAALHWYGKRDVRPLRKMGHVTALGDDVDEASARANEARDELHFE
ncbi:5-(carboxyamino)imidazole ribonucleotide synthase [Halarchaeum sp. CBA1220]|uniref:5-(carboxyamino)imidazole ribonucleotide synthase n=1 Tax=Halarchaeum sp. CBA1220 TaxID=1853682 RepID=UPI000F3AA1EE|nr:5-(carboxyamino)imidazole ribonucleotide synthase [Halarchaeum sp. CBA1220]QLC33961.1 5-(carboxyamino)imidazole ribonucleotide synthase [Halarchaeum sp. CBA1220]